MTYYANFNANGTHLQNPISDTNKRRILADIKEIAMGYATDGNGDVDFGN